MNSLLNMLRVILQEAFKELLEHHIADQDQKRGGPPDYDKQNSILNSLSFVLPNSTTYPSIDDKDNPALGKHYSRAFQ